MIEIIEIKEKVLKYMEKNNFIGIALRKEIQNFGWAGCQDVIQGEFIKNVDDISKKKIMYITKEINGIKVFIPEYLKNVKEMRISSLFSAFSKIMILNIETTHI